MNGIKKKKGKIKLSLSKKVIFKSNKLRTFSKNRCHSTTPIWLKFGRKGDFSV